MKEEAILFIESPSLGKNYIAAVNLALAACRQGKGVLRPPHSEAG